MRTLTVLLATAGLTLALSAPAQAAGLAADNVVEISPRLVTSGQPSAEMLAKLKALGFDAVIYLAPPTVMDAVRDEPLIVARQGLTFINIPIQFDNPTESDFETFAAVLHGLSESKVLVHCQINLRASSMVFLYRTVVLKEDPRQAYDAVAKVWSPSGPWRKLIENQLHKHKIGFELL
ncbi:MAG TPA: protein tyrosine phosphatase family protein [Burkholderiaceae bacterium]|nr:protein tyrosine phosphatase family protein [Burkholderiaceae bacterium]